MAGVSLYTYAVVDVAGKTTNYGSLEVPAFIALESSSQRQEFNLQVATETTVELWNVATNANLASFNFLWIQCDYDLMLELVTDKDADVGTEQFTVGLNGVGRDNEYGAPFILARDDSYANYTINFGGGSLDVVEIVRVRNLSTTQEASVTGVLAR